MRPLGALSRRDRGRRHRLVVALAVGGIGVVASLAAALPAQAVAPSGSIDQPAVDGATFSSEPASFHGTFSYPVQGQNGVIDEIRLSVSSAEAHPVPTPVDFTYAAPQSTQQFTWEAQFDYNGRYTLTATGTGHDVPPDGSGRQSQMVTRTFVMSVPPSKPTGLSATSDAATRSVRLSWASNPEPDLYGYVVERKGPSSGSYTDIGGTPTTSFTDSSVASLPAGQYSYEVVAYRRPGDGSTNYLPSEPSNAALATVSGTPQTTTTTAPPGVANGSGESGSSGAANPLAPIPPGGKLAPAPALPSLPRADAGDFGALLAQARASTTATTEPDPGYNSRLPFGPRSTREVVNVPGSAAQLAGGDQLGAGSGAQRRRLTFEYLAGGLVLFVLAMHALYLRRQLDQVLPLEALEPGEARIAE